MNQKNEARFIRWDKAIPDHFIFACAFILGCVWLVISRLIFDAPSWIALIGPIVVMASYVFFIFYARRYQLRGDRAADNLYYLGFLFTITALAISLIRYNRLPADPENSIALIQIVDTIIQDLGISLFTTLFGLFWRVVFSQMRTDPENIEEQSQIELTKTTAIVDAKLRNVIRNFERFNSRSTKALNETTDILTKAQDNIVTSFESLTEKIQRIEVPPNIIEISIEKSFQKLDESISSRSKELSNQFKEHIEKIDIKSDLLSSKLTPILIEFESATQNLANRINNVDFSPQILNEAVEKSFSVLHTSIQSVASQVSAMPTDIENLQKNFQSVAQLSTEIQRNLLEQQNNFSKALEQFTQTTNTMPELGQQFRVVSETVAASNKPLSEFNQILEKNSNTVYELQQRSASTTEKLLEEVTSATQQVHRMTREIQELATTFSDAMNSLVLAAQKDTKTL